jgi:hypothetical protein
MKFKLRKFKARKHNLFLTMDHSDTIGRKQNINILKHGILFTLFNFFGILLWTLCGPGSSVGIATGYRLGGPGIESRWGLDFPHLSRPALGPTQSPVQWVPGLSPEEKTGRCVTVTPHPLPVPWSTKVKAIPLLPLWAVRPVESLSACTRVDFTFFYLL